MKPIEEIDAAFGRSPTLRPVDPVLVEDHGQRIVMRLASLLRQLANVSVGDRCALSVYLDVGWRDEQQRERARLFVKHEIERARAERTTVSADDLARVEELVESLVRQSVDLSCQGCAIFLCQRAALDRVVWLDVRVAPRFVVAPQLHLRPLLGPVAERRALVLAIDSHRARLLELSASGAAQLSVMVADVPRRHKQGGWSQRNFEQHRRRHLSDHEHAAVDALLHAVIARQVEGLALPHLVVARPDVVAEVLRQMPAPLAARTRALDGEPSAPWFEMAPAVERELGTMRERQARELLVEVERRAEEGGAVVGAAATAAMACADRLMHLIISEHFCSDGAWCSRCGWIGANVAERCPSCAGLLTDGELGDALIRRAIACGARIDIDRSLRLERLGGVAALLRF